jgi:uncharacterized RDD family membrane protein YckC
VPTLLVRTPEGVALRYELAGAGSRFAAGLVDGLAIVAAFLLGALFLLAVGALGLAWTWLVAGLPAAAVAYQALFHSLLEGRTPGKALFGLRVVRKNGDRLGPIRSFIRGPAYLVDYLFFCLGFIWIMISKERRAWHDYIAGSCVVYDWDARPGARYRAARNRTRGS